MAIAVRSKNTHGKMRDIVRRHWLGERERHGVVSPDGRVGRFVVDNLVERTPQVIRTVRAQLPKDFAIVLADSILNGLQEAADKLANQLRDRNLDFGERKPR